MTQARLPGISLDGDTWSQFGMVAKRLGTTKSELIRDLIAAAVNDEQAAVLTATHHAAAESSRDQREQLDHRIRQLADEGRELARRERELRRLWDQFKAVVERTDLEQPAA